MKKRTVIWLLACVVVLVALYALVLNWGAIKERFFPEELKPYQGDGSVELLDISSVDSVMRLDWSLDGKDYTLFRNEENEFVSDDDSLEFDQEVVSQELMSSLSDFRASHILTDVNPADYGLDEPWLNFTVYDCGPDPDHPLPGDGNVTTFYVGMRNTVTDTCYATCDFETIYLLQGKLPDRFGSYQDFLVKEYAPEGSVPVYISIEHNGEKHEYRYPESDADGFYSVVFGWYEEMQDGSIQPVEIDAVSELYDLFSEEKWSANIETDPEDISIYGLDDPTYRVVFQYYYTRATTDDAGQMVSEQIHDEYVLLIGDPSDEENHYAMKEGSKVVRTLANADIEGLLNYDPEGMYMHFAIVPEWQSIRGMDITLPDGTNLVCEVRVGEDGKSTYFIQGTEVDKEDVRSVFLSLYNPSIDGIDPDANRSIEDAEIKVHFSRERANYTEMDLYLIPYNSALYVVDFAGQQQYLISKRVIDGIYDAVAEALELVK